ncbi:MAG: hypothetical protein CM1200mP41_04440 [Gammaproteobacteria bacterium]|nr:MAG: hypothetical protein CM1200mP41_04440 [Gammaproteobacteria bacterium]
MHQTNCVDFFTDFEGNTDYSALPRQVFFPPRFAEMDMSILSSHLQYQKALALVHAFTHL